jgi:hypothetical protein
MNEHECVVDEDRLRRSGLRQVVTEPEDPGVRLPLLHDARRDKGVHQLVELNGSHATGINLTRIIADKDDPHTVLSLEVCNEVKHLGPRLRLSNHEVAKLVPRKRSHFIGHHPIEVLFKGELK